MGASVSKNSVDIINEALTTVSKEIVNDSEASQTESIIIKAKADGDINISNVTNINIGYINSVKLLENFRDLKYKDKINAQIEQIGKALIKGINIANVAFATSEVNQIIKNCIQIKDISISKCSVQQELTILVDLDSKQNINYTDSTNKNISNAFQKCVTSEKSVTELIKETDSLIQQVTQSATIGIDLNMLMIGIAAVLGGSFIIGFQTLSKFLGPVMILVGGFFVYREYQESMQTNLDRKDLYLKNYLNYYDKSLKNISTKTISEEPTITDLQKTGSADLYEVFDKSLILYNQATSTLKVEDDLVEIDLTFIKTGNSIEMKITNSTKYKTVNFQIEQSFTNLKILTSEGNLNTTINPGDAVIDLSNFKYSKTIEITLAEVKDGVVIHTRKIGSYSFAPTIVYFKSLSSKPLSQNWYFIAGVLMVICGSVLSFINFKSK